MRESRYPRRNSEMNIWGGEGIGNHAQGISGRSLGCFNQVSGRPRSIGELLPPLWGTASGFGRGVLPGSRGVLKVVAAQRLKRWPRAHI